MRQFGMDQTLYGEKLTAQVLQLEEGVHVSVFGGQRAHIGAVSIVTPAGVCNTVQFPGHREGVISERWAKALLKAGFRPAVVEAGIHYDGLSKAGIDEVVARTDAMLAEVLAALQEKSQGETGDSAEF